MELSISGILLASMLQKMAISEDELEGLILGNISSQIIETVSDELQIKKKKILVGIQNIEFLGSTCSFYDFQGNIYNQKIDKLTNNENSSQYILGWFRFRRNTILRPSLRELSVQKNLEELCKKNNYNSLLSYSQPLLFGLFTFNLSTSKAILTYDYKFLKITYFNNKIEIEPIELKITNLMHSSLLEYNDFNPSSSFSLLFNQKLENELIENTIQNNIYLEIFFQKTLEKLKITIEEVQSSFNEIKKLEEEIVELQKKTDKNV